MNCIYIKGRKISEIKIIKSALLKEYPTVSCALSKYKGRFKQSAENTLEVTGVRMSHINDILASSFSKGHHLKVERQ